MATRCLGGNVGNIVEGVGALTYARGSAARGSRGEGFIPVISHLSSVLVERVEAEVTSPCKGRFCIVVGPAVLLKRRAVVGLDAERVRQDLVPSVSGVAPAAKAHPSAELRGHICTVAMRTCHCHR